MIDDPRGDRQRAGAGDGPYVPEQFEAIWRISPMTHPSDLLPPERRDEITERTSGNKRTPTCQAASHRVSVSFSFDRGSIDNF